MGESNACLYRLKLVQVVSKVVGIPPCCFFFATFKFSYLSHYIFVLLAYQLGRWVIHALFSPALSHP
jgi:hypothetical protein